MTADLRRRRHCAQLAVFSGDSCISRCAVECTQIGYRHTRNGYSASKSCGSPQAIEFLANRPGTGNDGPKRTVADLQPFDDVNRRVSRLAANIPLVRLNLCPLSFVDVPERAYVDGVLGTYELNRIELLRDVFLWAYERSAARYSAVRRSLGEPEPFRMRYRARIATSVAEIVRSRLDKKAATAHIRQAGTAIPECERARFLEVVETELMSLHEGNIARYRIRPSEFRDWRERWH